MKRLITAFVLLGISVALSIWSNIIFEKKMINLSDSLSILIECSESCSKEELSEKAELLVFQWETCSPLLHSLILHEGTDEIEQNITSLPLVIEYGTDEEFKSKCIETINRIDNLIKAEKLTVENIF